MPNENNPERTETAVIRTPDQRLRVFISSTLKELAPEREAAQQAVASLRLIPVLFETGARPHPPRNLYRAYLAQSHIFLGIYWQSYGWVAPDMDVSGLEDELRLSHGTPKLIYIKTPAPDREPQLHAMLQQIKRDDAISYKYFADADELRELIGNDLALLLTEHFEQARRLPAQLLAATPGNGRSSLPHPITSLIGRAAEVTAVSDLLQQPDVRLVTLIGPGGVGKTRLSLAAAAALENVFADGVYWVNLAAVQQPERVIAAIAQALDVREREGNTLMDSVQSYLHGKQLLLLLDNFEQVVAAGRLLAALLTAAPQVKLLVTSRVALRLRGEREYPVQPLPVPAASTSDLLPDTAAVRLFVARARAARPDFELNAENGRAVAQIVQRLDGLPLAIELAAARIKLLPPRLLLARLADRLQLLTGGAQDLPPRQQTMRSVMRWSYDLLSPPNQILFARLGVFVGGFSLETAAAVCRLDDDLDIFEGVATLLDNSLLQTKPTVDGQPRFFMLETVRAYAYERLQECADFDPVRARFAAFLADYALTARTHLFSGASEAWLDRLTADVDNFRTLLEWGQTAPRFQHASWPLIPGLIWFTYRRGYLHEARRWCAQAIAQTETLGDNPLRASILVHAGLVAMWQSDLAAAARLMDAGLAMMRRVGDTAGLMDALFPRGVLAVNQSDGPRAQQLFGEALPLFTAAGLPWFQAMVHLHLGNVAFNQGDLVQATAHTETAHALGQQVGDPWIVASVVNNFGELARFQGQHMAADPFYRESRALFQQIRSAPDMARADHSLGWVQLAQGKLAAARGLFTAAMAQHEQLGIKRGVVECQAGLAAVRAAEGKAETDVETAVTQFAAVHTRFQQLGANFWPADAQDVRQHLDAARARLDAETFDAAWARGQADAAGALV